MNTPYGKPVKGKDYDEMPGVKHTPTPWHSQAYMIWQGVRAVADCRPDNGKGPLRPMNEPECLANIEFIIRAVNSHEELRNAIAEALKLCQVHDTQTGFYKAVDAYALHKILFKPFVNSNPKAGAKAEDK